MAIVPFKLAGSIPFHSIPFTQPICITFTMVETDWFSSQFLCRKDNKGYTLYIMGWCVMCWLILDFRFCLGSKADQAWRGLEEIHFCLCFGCDFLCLSLSLSLSPSSLCLSSSVIYFFPISLSFRGWCMSATHCLCFAMGPRLTQNQIQQRGLHRIRSKIEEQCVGINAKRTHTKLSRYKYTSFCNLWLWT